MDYAQLLSLSAKIFLFLCIILVILVGLRIVGRILMRLMGRRRMPFYVPLMLGMGLLVRSTERFMGNRGMQIVLLAIFIVFLYKIIWD